MLFELVGRNLVCLGTLTPSGVSLERFEESVGLPRPQTQIANPQLTLGEYDGVRLLGLEGRVQLDVGAAVEATRRRAAGAAVLDQLAAFRPTALGLNGIVRVVLEGDERDPTESLLAIPDVSERLSASPIRGGFKAVYSTEAFRMTIGVDPDLDDASAWVGSANRHYDYFPEGEARDSALDWFASDQSEKLFITLLRDSGE